MVICDLVTSVCGTLPSLADNWQLCNGAPLDVLTDERWVVVSRESLTSEIGTLPSLADNWQLCDGAPLDVSPAILMGSV